MIFPDVIEHILGEVGDFRLHCLPAIFLFYSLMRFRQLRNKPDGLFLCCQDFRLTLDKRLKCRQPLLKGCFRNKDGSIPARAVFGRGGRKGKGYGSLKTLVASLKLPVDDLVQPEQRLYLFIGKSTKQDFPCLLPALILLIIGNQGFTVGGKGAFPV